MPWFWWISPFCQPENMPEILEKEGFARRERLLPAMMAFLHISQLPNWPQPDPVITIRRVNNQDDLKAASFIRHTGFKFPARIGESYFNDMPEAWCDPIDRDRLYIAKYKNGPFAALGALVYAEGIPGIYVMATLPEYGRNGFGQAILYRLMFDALANGDQIIALTASSSGIGLYKKFGFTPIFDYKIYQIAD